MAQRARPACSELRIYVVVVTDRDCRVNRSVVSDKNVGTLQKFRLINPEKFWTLADRANLIRNEF